MLLLLFAPFGAQIYAVIYAAALGEPSAAQIKAGQNVNGVTAVWSGSVVAPTVTTVFDWPTLATGLTAGTSYRVSFVWSDGASDSNVVTSDAFSTDAAAVSGAQIFIPILRRRRRELAPS